MSVIIKCMKMPAGCMDCNLLYMDRGGAYCMATNNCAEEEGGADQYEYTRPDWCPLVELPGNHGRLVDADEMLAKAKKQSGPMTGDGWDNLGVYALIESQKTVVEAEDKK